MVFNQMNPAGTELRFMKRPPKSICGMMFRSTTNLSRQYPPKHLKSKAMGRKETCRFLFSQSFQGRATFQWPQRVPCIHPSNQYPSQQLWANRLPRKSTRSAYTAEKTGTVLGNWERQCSLPKTRNIESFHRTPILLSILLLRFQRVQKNVIVFISQKWIFMDFCHKEHLFHQFFFNLRLESLKVISKANHPKHQWAPNQRDLRKDPPHRGETPKKPYGVYVN